MFLKKEKMKKLKNASGLVLIYTTENAEIIKQLVF
jgi:hypothetical protein